MHGAHSVLPRTSITHLVLASHGTSQRTIKTQTQTQTLKFVNPKLRSRQTAPAKTFEPRTSMDIIFDLSTTLRTATTLILQADDYLSHPSRYRPHKPSIIPFN